MTFTQFVAVVREWTDRLTPEQARKVTESMMGYGTVEMPPGTSIDIDSVLAIAAGGEPLPMPEAVPPPELVGADKLQRREPSKPLLRTPRPARHRRLSSVSERAHKLLRQQLASGPKPGVLVEAAAEAADISKRTLISAADALGVRTQRGQWWLPGP
jgi:hypothetical protein